MAALGRTGGLDGDAARRLHRALTADKEELFAFLNDPSPDVVGAALRNPVLDENHLLSLLKRRDLPEGTLMSIHRHPLVEGSHRLKVAVARNPGSPPQVTLSLLPHLYLFELLDLCLLPGMTQDQKVAAERAIIRRLPSSPQGAKRTLARRGTAAVAEAILHEGEASLVPACLDNPRLPEAAVFRFLNGPSGTPETVSEVARHPRWKSRPGLRLALLKNARTPLVWFTVHLPVLAEADLKGLLASKRLTVPQGKAVEEEIRRRGKRKGG